MTRIKITLEVAEEMADPSHIVGLTNDAYEELLDTLMAFGSDITIEREQ